MNQIQEYLPRHFALGVGVFVLIFVLVILSKRYYESTTTNPAVIQKGASIIKQSADLAFGAQQITNPLMALRNANYAMAYLNVARSLARDDELSDAARVDLDNLQVDVEREELAAKERILQICPQAAGRTRLARTAGYVGGKPIASSALRAPIYQRDDTTAVTDTQFTSL